MKQSKLLGLGTIALAAVMMTACGGDVPDPGNTTCDPACTDGKVCKDGQCVAETTSECDPACTDGKVCKDGQCVDKEVPKPGECDPACGENQECKDGTCVNKEISCPDGQTLCGDTCRDLSKENEHCGQCDNACTDGKQCVNSACDFVCNDSAPDKCDDGCHNFKTDINNCGECGKKCGDNEACNDGNCGILCNDGEMACGNECKDIQKDNSNCGACGVICDESKGETCKAGNCEMSCPAGEEMCGDGKCYNLDSDANCGTCDNHPACDTSNNQHCSASRLCETACTGSDSQLIFVDLMTTPAFCGSCDNACNEGELCNDGQCSLDCGSEKTLCGDICVDAKTDVAHCGCGGRDVPDGGINCAELPNVAEGSTCADGVCVISACLEGFADCDKDPSNGCEANLNDPETCGTCENACKDENADSASCNAGVCEFVCKSGMLSCNGTCKDIQNDNDNCGWCDNKCTGDATCQNGFCSISECGENGYVSLVVNDQKINAFCINTESEFRNMRDAINRGKKFAGQEDASHDALGNDNLNNAYIIMDDLKLGNQANWIPIGTSSNNFNKGYFFGNGKKIEANLTVTGDNVGLFGYVTNSVLDGFNLKVDVTANNSSSGHIGGLVGEIRNSIVTHSQNEGNIVVAKAGNDWKRTGLLLGELYSTVVNECRTSGKISFFGKGQIGGIAGTLRSASEVNTCSTIIDIHQEEESSEFEAVGGLVGLCEDKSFVENSTASGKIEIPLTPNRSYGGVGGLVGSLRGDAYVKKSNASTEVVAPKMYRVGGLVGHVEAGADAGHNSTAGCRIENSFATGNVTCHSYCGGLLGAARAGTFVEKSHATGDVTSTNGWVGGLIGYMTTDSSIKSKVTSCYATGKISNQFAQNIGGAIGRIDNSEAEDIYATGDVEVTSDTTDWIGGAIGQLYGSKANKVYATGNVTGGRNIGGLIGVIQYASLDNGASFGTVKCLTSGTSQGGNAGGLVGSAWQDINITNSFSAGDVFAGDGVGTVLGTIVQDGTSMLRNVYGTGNLKGKTNVGGIVGSIVKGTLTVKNAYYWENSAEQGIGKGNPASLDSDSFKYNEDKEAVLTTNTNRKLAKALGNDWTTATCTLSNGPKDTVTIAVPKALSTNICK